MDAPFLSRRFRIVVALATVCSFGVAGTGSAQEGWVRVESPSFTVVSNAGERSARSIASQFERFRAAVETTWPWARARLDRPVAILGAKDENTMRLLAPQYWARGSQFKPASVFVTGPDRHYIAIRTDVRAADTAEVNPYQLAYWSYSALLLTQAFEPALPIWLRNGLAGVLSNSIVRDAYVEFGRPSPGYVRTFTSEPRLTLAEFLNVDSRSDYYRNPVTRDRFDAQSWALVHYMMFGRPDAQAEGLNQLVGLLTNGQSTPAAVQAVFGDLEALGVTTQRYVSNGIFRYGRVPSANSLDERTLAVVPLSAIDTRATRLTFHLAMGDLAAAREALQTSTGQPSVALLDAEAMLLEREGRNEDAARAYARAADAGSTNAASLYRLANLEWTAGTDTASLTRRLSLLTRALAANDRMAPAHAMLADTYISLQRTREAVASARTAVALESARVAYRLTLARALWFDSQRDDARGQALAARRLAADDAERERVQSLLDFFDRQSVPQSPPAR